MPESSARLSPLVKLGSVAFAVAVLYLAREVLQPLSLAALLAFLLAPAVRAVERLGAGRVVAVAAVATGAFAALAVLGWLIVAQLFHLASGLGGYRENIHARVESLRERPGGLDQAGEVLQEVTEELREEEAAAPAGRTVAVLAEEQSPVGRLREVLMPVLAPLGTAGVVVVFVLFFLLEREDLRDRLIRLAGEGELLLTTQAMDDAARRVSRYLLMQLLVNLAYGVPVGVGLWAIGVPNALLWGILAVLLRYLPYVGPWIAAVAPFVLSLAVFPGWGRPLAVLALFLVLELIINNFLEPYVYGAQTGLSPVALLLAALFWAWLWGPVGLVLATPLTVCLVVLGRHVHHLEFLAVLFGDEPALSPAVRLYQRLLAGDTLEAVTLAEEALVAGTPLSAYDELLLPALALEERDHHRGALDAVQRPAILAAVRELVALGGRSGAAEAARTDSSPPARPPAAPRRQVLCIPAHDEADALGGVMLAQVLEAQAIAVAAAREVALAGEVVEAVAAARPDAVVLCSLPPSAVAHSRYLCKRLRARCPDVALVVGLFQSAERAAAAREELLGLGATNVVTTLAEAVDAIARLPLPAAAAPGAAPAAPPGR